MCAATERPVVLAVVVHRGDAGVVQRGDGAGLDPEPVQELRVARQLGAQDLHGDVAAQPDVFGLPHLAHPADGDAPVELVAVGDAVAGGEDAHGTSSRTLIGAATGVAVSTDDLAGSLIVRSAAPRR